MDTKLQKRPFLLQFFIWRCELEYLTQQWIQNTWRKSSILQAQQCSCVLGAVTLGKVWMDGNLPMEILLDHSFCTVLLPKTPLMTQDLYKQSCLCSPLGVLDNKANRVSEFYCG